MKNRWRPAQEGATCKKQKGDGDAGCWAWLPDELWDLVLNGADQEGRPFLDPMLRVVPRLVCTRWRLVVENPLKRWVHGHLDCALKRRLHLARTSHWADALVRGRVVTASGLLLHVEACVEASDAHIDRETAIEAKIEAFLDSAGIVLDNVSKNATVVRQTLVDVCNHTVVGGGALPPITHLYGSRSARHVVSALIAWGRIPCAMALLRERAVLQTPSTSDIVHIALTMVHHCRDDASTFMGLLATRCHKKVRSGRSARRRVSRKGTALWDALARTGSVRCLAALASTVYTSVPESIDSDLALLLTRAGLVTIEANTEHGVPYPLGHSPWLDVVLDCADPVAVVAARAHEYNDVLQYAIIVALDKRRYAQADDLIAWGRQRGLLQNIDVERLFERALFSLPHALEVTRWVAARRHIEPHKWLLRDFIDRFRRIHAQASEAQHVAQFGVALTAIATVWPDIVIRKPRKLTKAIGFLVLRAQWAFLERIMAALQPSTLRKMAACREQSAPASAAKPRLALWGLLCGEHLHKRLNVHRHVYDGGSPDASSDQKWRTYYGVPDSAADRDMCTRIVLIVRLGAYCDPNDVSERADVWRFWCGTPAPVPETPMTRAILDAYRRGLLVPADSMTAPL